MGARTEYRRQYLPREQRERQGPVGGGRQAGHSVPPAGRRVRIGTAVAEPVDNRPVGVGSRRRKVRHRCCHSARPTFSFRWR